MKRILFFLASSIIISAKAQIGGDYTFSFLNLADNAKVASLGSDLISAFDSSDVNSGSYNPANIQESHSKVLGFNFLSLKQGIKIINSYFRNLLILLLKYFFLIPSQLFYFFQKVLVHFLGMALNK